MDIYTDLCINTSPIFVISVGRKTEYFLYVYMMFLTILLRGEIMLKIKQY